MSKSRWANASRDELEALAHASEGASTSGDWSDWHAQMVRLRASCPPLRTEAEVAAEALAILRNSCARNGRDCLVAIDEDTSVEVDRLRALAKEPTR